MYLGLDASPPASTHELTIPNDVSMPGAITPPTLLCELSPSLPTLRSLLPVKGM